MSWDVPNYSLSIWKHAKCWILCLLLPNLLSSWNSDIGHWNSMVWQRQRSVFTFTSFVFLLPTVSTRSFLRFLVATRRCPSGLVHALPRSANWQLTSIPRFLPDTEIGRIIDACDGEQYLRDRAIILLLARLGLRASEVARLTFDDLDWSQGHIRIHGKGRRLELLPLTQEIGDAIIAYVTRQRPPLPTHALFVTVVAPVHEINRIVVKCLVNRALTRAGIDSPHRGAHILRHSAATAMLRHGVSLADVGSVLRHRDTAITAHYAKVDQTLLSVIAQPWGGRAPC
jgi:site-specific recombinase XerD